MKNLLFAVATAAMMFFGLNGSALAAELEACTGAQCSAGAQCTQPNGKVATCGDWGGGTCNVSTSDQAVADHTCKCIFDKTYNEGCTPSSMAPVVGGKANAATPDKAVQGDGKKGPAKNKAKNKAVEKAGKKAR